MTGPSDGGSSVAFSPDGQMALLGDDNGAIRLWDIQPSPDPRTFSGHTHVVAATKLSPAGGHLWYWERPGPPGGRGYPGSAGHADRVCTHT